MAWSSTALMPAIEGAIGTPARKAGRKRPRPHRGRERRLRRPAPAPEPVLAVSQASVKGTRRRSAAAALWPALHHLFSGSQAIFVDSGSPGRFVHVTSRVAVTAGDVTRRLSLPARSLFMLGPRGTGKTTCGSEVDFVWTRARRTVAIEVKASERWRPEFSRAFRTLAEGWSVGTAFGVYLGPRELKDGPVRVMRAFPRALAGWQGAQLTPRCPRSSSQCIPWMPV